MHGECGGNYGLALILCGLVLVPILIYAGFDVVAGTGSWGDVEAVLFSLVFFLAQLPCNIGQRCGDCVDSVIVVREVDSIALSGLTHLVVVLWSRGSLCSPLAIDVGPFGADFRC